MHFEKELGTRIFDIYKRTIFGKVSKVEIDLIVFSFLVKKTFNDISDIYSEGSFNWFRVSPSHIRQLSLQLQIPESRVSSLLEQAALLELNTEDSDSQISSEIIHLLKSTRQTSKDIKDGKIKLYVPNKVTRAAITSYLAKNNSVPDLSFSQNVMTIRLVDLISDYLGDDIIKVLEERASKANENDKKTEIRKIIKAAEKLNGLEQSQALLGGALRIFFGTGGEYLSNEFIDFLLSIINKKS